VPYHPAEQALGTTEAQVRLIDAALAASPSGRHEWGICTECGMGRKVDRQALEMTARSGRQGRQPADATNRSVR
jgi:hypothetical protein